MKLSALIITFNEEKHIEQCIRSLKNVTDEIIVVDSYSTDKTPDICNKLEVTFILNRYKGQVQQKNFALSKASFDHVLSIDADEELTEELKASILKEKALGFPYDGYYFKRLNNYGGKWVRHGGWYPEWKLRLWNKNKASWLGTNPHDKVVLDHPHNSKKLTGHLLHFAFDSEAEHERRISQYAKIGAESLFSHGKRSSILHRLLSPVLKFVRDYFFKLGFLDGKTGFTIARLSAKTKYLKYKELSKLHKQR